ncbi:benzoate 4-monooxygenase cytochrome p450 [Penicillium paradoxum]|uniref:benzoate 4-monooxygenase cytochrome p450 n=1 Tax=Penicillium paradoxum TaxID=176176 RepID=UPI002547D930|nr:benzoate 4-monooxygenase cytochrome p450 [Penicillium paradoxum]KAJ5788009.1 benzoate 4-monooxygenase cytochrome p450 [Penicillium paradoxum]
MIMSLELGLFVLLLLYMAVTALYRLTLHPLSHIPGPRIAAVTQLYQTFYCYYGNKSRFYQQVDRLHAKYGPVVRITPDEISLNDPENYSKIYHVGTKYWKAPEYYRVFGAPAAFFTTVGNRLHSIRRAPLNTFFSRKSVVNLEPLVQQKARVLIARLQNDLDCAGDRTCGTVQLHNLFSALSIDVASDYSFHDCYGLLETEGGGHDFSSMVRGVLKSFWFFMQFETIENLALRLPSWVSSALSPALRRYNTMVEGTRRNVTTVKAQVEGGHEKPLRRSIFHELLESDAPPSVDDMTDIALTIIVAAAAATGNALSIMAFYVISDAEIYQKLHSELVDTFPEDKPDMSWSVLEKLPYLAAVVKESLRLSYGVIGRLPRIVPESGAEFNGYFIPPGTTVGMSSWTMHRSPAIFPEPNKFDPGRWLDPAESNRLQRYLVSFGKDSRQCIGMPLAYCELYVTAAALFRTFGDLEIVDTQVSDLVFDDYFSGYHPEHATPLRVARRR